MIRAVRGTRDILPPSSAVWNHVERVAREVFRAYNYQEIRTPIFEETQLFARGVGEETDIVTKEMYTFADRDGESLTLRPENTASVIRAYIEHRLDQLPGLQKLYYMGPMFRRERPQKGRYRQFAQIGAEAIGSPSPVVDAEVIEMVAEILTRCGLTGFSIYLNSVGCRNCRPDFVEALREALVHEAPKLCGDCQRRAVTNPLRVLDCKVPQDQPVIDALPSIQDHLCAECRTHSELVLALLGDRAIPFEVKPRLVRGLDYYSHTAFEFTTDALGAQGTVLAGGRYDGLIGQMGGPPTPGIGWAAGVERLALLVADPGPRSRPIAIVPVSAAEADAALKLAQRLRHAGFAVDLGYSGNVGKRMKRADKIGAGAAIVLGESELARDVAMVRDMKTGEQVEIPLAELEARLAGYR